MLSKIYVVNLEKDIERKQNIEANLKQYQVKYEIFPAIYGKNLSKDVIDSHTSFSCRHFLCNKSIIGSGMSHWKLWEIISKQPAGWYMICEDDINFKNDTLSLLQKVFNSVPATINDPVLLNLNACQAYNPHISSNKIVYESNLICGISCYIITPETAKKLLNFMNKNKLNNYIDLQISFCNCGIKQYIVPVPIVQDSAFGGYKTSNNMSYAYSVPLLQFIIDVLLPHETSSVVNFRLNLMAGCIEMKYCISFGQICIICLLLLNILWIKNTYLSFYIFVEILLFIMFSIQKSFKR